MEGWTDYFETIADGLRRMAVTDRSGSVLSPAEGVARWVAMTRATHEHGGQLYIIGNGGSAGMASHMAADASKNGHLRAMAFNDVALLTAISNDLAYDQVFSLPLERLARPGDARRQPRANARRPQLLRAPAPLRLDRVGASGDPALLVRSVLVRAPPGCDLMRKGAVPLFRPPLCEKGVRPFLASR